MKKTHEPDLNDLELFNLYQLTKKFDENGKLLSSDDNMRNDLAVRNAKLVTFVINKFYNKKTKHKMMRNDLLQEGHIGLFEAIDGYKPELGFKFSTYATWWIRQSVNAYIQDEEPIFHIPSHIRTARNKLESFAKDNSILLHQISKESLVEIGMTSKMFASVEAANKTKSWNHICLDAPISSSNDGGSNKSMKDIIPSTNGDFAIDFDNKRLLEACIKSFRKLDIREQFVLLERYGFDGKYGIAKVTDGEIK